MKVTFTQDRILLDGRKIATGETIDCSTEDGEAFIANGVAVAVAADKKGVKSDV